MKHTSTYLALLTNRIFTTGQRKIHNSSINGLFTVHVCLLGCGVTNFRVIGPYFFKDKDGHAVTVTCANYVEILQNFLTPELSHQGIELLTIWFQQDGATASMEVIQEMFPKHIISLCGELPCLHLISLPVIISFGGTSK
jgi:hypothetical protein